MRLPPGRPVVRPLLLVFVLLAGIFAMHGVSGQHNAALTQAHSASYVAPDVRSMTGPTSPSTLALSDDRGRDGGHQSQLGAQACLAVLAAAITLLLLLLFSAFGWYPGGVLMAVRTASRQRLSRGPPRVFALSLAQLNVLRT